MVKMVDVNTKEILDQQGTKPWGVPTPLQQPHTIQPRHHVHLDEGLKSALSCPINSSCPEQNRDILCWKKKMISLQKGSGNWSPGSEKMESYLWRNHILQWKNNMMLRYTFKQRHVRSGIFSFHYVFHYLRVRLNLGVYIFQNTTSPALRKCSGQLINSCNWDLET